MSGRSAPQDEKVSLARHEGKRKREKEVKIQWKQQDENDEALSC